jgi:hypothetical protein
MIPDFSSHHTSIVVTTTDESIETQNLIQAKYRFTPQRNLVQVNIRIPFDYPFRKRPTRTGLRLHQKEKSKQYLYSSHEATMVI